jgi:hypothetical protein
VTDDTCLPCLLALQPEITLFSYRIPNFLAKKYSIIRVAFFYVALLYNQGKMHNNGAVDQWFKPILQQKATLLINCGLICSGIEEFFLRQFIFIFSCVHNFQQLHGIAG